MNFAPPLGSLGPDFPLWHLDERETSLSEICSQHSFTIVEFGSFTGPYCGMAAPSMNGIADRFSEQGVGSIFLYTHEAHPGEYYPHLTSMEQKYKHARDLREQLEVTRPVLLDALNGACHQAYGSIPNVSWIFNKAGIPIYKSDCTDANSVENAIEYFLGMVKRRRSGEQMVPFQVERLDFRTRDVPGFMAGLERNGPKAVKEFNNAF